MRRGRGQVLYRFLPNQIVDYSDTNVIGKVNKWQGRELSGVDLLRLVELIKRSAARFGKRIQGYPSGWLAEDFVLIEPTAVELDLFPLTFFCKRCDRATRFKDVDEFRRKAGGRNYRCPRCGQGELEQADIVHYHTCGNLESLVVRTCDIHQDGHIILEKFGSSAIRNWYWRCTHPEHGSKPRDLARVGAHCFKHSPSERMSHGPFRRSEVFYPESVTMVNVPPLASDRPLDETMWKLVLAEYLGLIPVGTARQAASSGSSVLSQASLRERRRELIREGLDPDTVDRVIRGLGLTEDAESLQRAMDAVNRVIRPTGNALVGAASLTYGYLQIVNAHGTKSLSDMVAKARGPNAERIREAPQLLNELGLADAHITTAFPIVRAVYGYSRGDPERHVSKLRAFPKSREYPQKTPIYGTKIETEAILVTLDRKRVREWLHQNLSVGGERPEDEPGLMSWFVNNVRLEAVPLFEEIPDTEVVTKWVYRLTHTLSHLLLKQASSIVGVDRNSLGEVIFPSIPAFAIFVNSSQKFQLGGMYTLFENAITPWLEIAAEEVQRCLHDPVCLEGDAACLACLYLGEVSCEHFNRELGRDVIIGSPSGHPQRGYWGAL